MASFGKTLELGADYAVAWPLQPELAAIFPEQRLIPLLKTSQKIIPALIVISTCLQLQWGNPLHWPTLFASFMFAVSLPMQGYFWLGRRAETNLPPSLSRWYREINNRMNCSIVTSRPNYFDLAKTLRKAYEQLDRAFIFN